MSFADSLVALASGELPPAVLARANVLLKDHVGVTIGGAPADSSVAVRRALGGLGATGRATVVGATDRFPPPHAALANGAAAHALEMDDTHQGGSIHLGVSVFPAALAAAELSPATGERVLRAAIAGYEAAARLAMALRPAAHYRRGFHPTGTCGAFGAATAAALVLGLDVDGVAAALGIAGSQAAGSMEFLTDGTWTKRLHPGWAACAGVHAAALARAGFRAPTTIVEGRFGFLHAYSDEADVDALAVGGEPEIMRTAIKPHACCRYMQGPIDAALALRARGRGIEAIERIEVGMLDAGFAIVCEPADAKRRPASVVDAQFSLPFGVALALVRGVAGPDDFAPDAWNDHRVRALMDRVVAVRDPALDARFPREWPCWVRVVSANGTIDEARVDHPRGDPENFPSASELDGKFRSLAGRVLTAAAIDRLEDALDRFSSSGSVRALLDAAVPTVT